MKTVFLIASLVCVMNAFKLERHSGIFFTNRYGKIMLNTHQFELKFLVFSEVKKDFIVDTLC